MRICLRECNAMNALRTFLIAAGLLGAAVFTMLFAISLLSPIWIERAAIEITRVEVSIRCGWRDGRFAVLTRFAVRSVLSLIRRGWYQLVAVKNAPYAFA